MVITKQTKGTGRHLLILTVFAASLINSMPALAQNKVALVIGNSKYQFNPLKNPVNDAVSMTKTLKQLGFNSVQMVLDADRKTMFHAIRDFSERLKPGSVALVYYSGHGAQYRNQNYLLPVNLDAEYDDELPVQAINSELIMDKMQNNRNGLNIVIFDACRNNTLRRRNRSATRGLARVENQPPNTYLIYSTAPGSVAADNERENNGLFTKHLMRYIKQPGLDLDNMMIETRKAVLKASNNRQNPFDTGSLTTRFCFAGCDANQQVVRVAEAPKPKPIKVALATPARVSEKTRTVVVKPQASQGATKPFEPRMQRIVGGRFTMGCTLERDNVLGGCDADEKPAISVNLKPYQISRTEITFAQWDACTEAGVCIKAQDQGWGRGQQPVMNVSWTDVQTYAKWLSAQTGKRFQLPTEAQWAFAARAGSNAAFPWGNTITCNNANYGNYKNECNTDRAKPVGSFAANRFGLQDTTGNVWEWVQDCWSGSLQGASPQGVARQSCQPSGKHVVRGGSWSNDSRIIRTASRHGYNDGTRSRIIGFRLAISQ